MLILRLTLALISLSFMGLQASAQPAPQYDRSQLAVGALYSWESSDGLSKAINLGFDGQDYRFKITDLAADGRQFDTIYGTNQHGRLVWYTYNGNTESYLPHDCSFLKARCETQVLRNGIRVGSTVTNAHFQSGIWIHTVNSNTDGQAPSSHRVCGIYDQDSIIQVLYIIYSNDDPYWMRTTSGPNAGRSREMLARVMAACQNTQPIS